MTTAAVFAVAVAFGAWVGIRSERAISERGSADLTTYLLSIPADEWKQ